MTGPDSFGKFLLEDGTMEFYLINDKYKDGFKKNIYALSKKDKEAKLKYDKYGSSFGTKINTAIEDEKYIRAILTISTYGKEIDNVPFGIFR